MKLEVGKYYKDNVGDKWKCVHNFDYGGAPFICVSDNRCKPTVARFSPNGVTDTLDLPRHIISEWVEPVEHEVDVWFYRGIGKAIVPTKCYDEGLDVIAKVKVKFTEGEGL